MLVMTGVVSLMLNTVGSRTKAYDRNKAIELSQTVMERIVEAKTSNPTEFWTLGSTYWTSLGPTADDLLKYPDYGYTVSVSNFTEGNCNDLPTRCIDVVINMTWKGGNTSDRYNRLFSNK